LQERLARLKLMGIQNKDDMLLQYAMESGYIDADPLEKIMHPERVSMGDRSKRYTRGILNPRRLIKGDWGMNLRKDNAKNLLSMNPGSAHLLGTAGHGFSAVPNLTPETEGVSGFKALNTEMSGFLQ
jgi:hypothetical protein